MTPAQMAAKINSCKLGIPIDLTTHINLATKKWVSSDEYYKETHGGKDRTEVRK